MAKSKIDLRSNDWRDAIVEIADAVKSTQLTNRALALMITDMTRGVSMTQAMVVLEAIPQLKKRYLK